MRALLVCILVGAQLSAAAPELKLPPSEGWEVAVDDSPPTGGTHGQFFMWKKDHNIQLRVATFAAQRIDYTDAWVLAVSAEMGKQSRAAGRNLHVTEGLVFELDGAKAAKLRTEDGDSRVILYWLPGEGGDVVLSLIGANGAWDDKAMREVERSVNAVKGLRRPPPTLDASMLTATNLAVAAVLGVALIGGIIAFALRKQAT
ncbi:MAG: hypothetical protein Q8L48_30030 [Archangium sp.]|nr:hypothetical protein [Archangium sp.]